MNNTQEERNEKLLLSARSLDSQGIQLWLNQGADAQCCRSRALVIAIGFGSLECCQQLLPYSDVELVAQQFLENEVGFEPEEVSIVLDWFALKLPPELQKKWVQVFEGLCPQTQALVEKSHLLKSLPNVDDALHSNRIEQNRI